MVVHGEDGLDEITISDGTKVSRFRNDEVETFYLSPEDFGLERSPVSSLVGGDRNENAEILLRIFRGEKGPKRDIVLMNSAAALVVAGKTEDLREGLMIAAEAIDSGNALRKLEEVIRVSNKI
jgi:anthranilate phosphoribosyltransferase